MDKLLIIDGNSMLFRAYYATKNAFGLTISIAFASIEAKPKMAFVGVPSEEVIFLPYTVA